MNPPSDEPGKGPLCYGYARPSTRASMHPCIPALPTDVARSISRVGKNGPSATVWLRFGPHLVQQTQWQSNRRKSGEPGINEIGRASCRERGEERGAVGPWK